MKVKTSELSGRLLNWAVAICEEEDFVIVPAEKIISFPQSEYAYAFPRNGSSPYDYDTNWNRTGRIKERERINVEWEGEECGASYDRFSSHKWENKGYGVGPTELVAVLRCYVDSKLGDEVDVPEELL